MSSAAGTSSYIVLIDDDAHSARLLTRMLLAHGSPRIEAFSAPQGAMSALTAQPAQNWPDLLIIDLKAHSAANLECLVTVGELDIPIAVMAQFSDRETAAALHDAGAAAVFTRHAHIDAYRREAANIVSFWVRKQRLDAVGM